MKKGLLKKCKNVKTESVHMYLMSLVIFLFLALVILIHKTIPGSSSHQPLHLQKEDHNKPKEVLFFNMEAFNNIEVEAKAYGIYDIKEKRMIVAKNESKQLPLASITKLITSLTALSLEKERKEETQIVINPSVIEGGYDLGLKKNQTWHLKELLKYMLIFSSNDAALTVANQYGGIQAFIGEMNTYAKNHGMSATFTDPAGRDVDGKIGGIGTIKDAVDLFVITRNEYPELLDATTKKRQMVRSVSEKISGIPNTNQYIESLPFAEGSKTGYTRMAGGNLGVVVDISLGRPVVIVVLGSSHSGRFKDVETLHKALEKSIISTKRDQQ